MSPQIICHMLSSVDGKIDGAALRTVMVQGDYEATGTKLEDDAWICGCTTMQQHFAEDEPFVSASNRPAGPHPVQQGERSRMRYWLIPSGSSAGQAAISTGIT